MGTSVCMNVTCSSNTSIHWKKGWKLRSGGFADLCDNCGSAYEQLIYCDTFHLKETGWRECSSCRKRLHCGCIASKSFLELLDNGGVECISCVRSAQYSFIPRDEEVNRCRTLVVDTLGETQQTSSAKKKDVINRENLMYFGLRADGDGHINLHQSQKDGTNGSLQHIKGEQRMSPVGDIRTPNFSNLKRPFMGSLIQTGIGMNMGNSSGNNIALRVPGLLVDGRDQNTLASSFQQGHNLMKIGTGFNSEASKDVLPQARVGRPPPVEGRCRPQLLSRYWPKITDQELQQIAGDTNSTIVPLFEKVLSASDAGRIGRLVLPKACAEAYFPQISQPEGLPIRIQDIKGKDWIFQFRFWPNNNSRMYVLEGVTSCIHSMQLQAGDTVTFSRIDPEGKLLMGFRKTSSPVIMQENQRSAMSSVTLPFSGADGNRHIVSGYSNHNRSLKGNMDPHLSALSDLNFGNGDISWHKAEDNGGWPGEGLPMQQPLLVQRSRKIGSKGKRMFMETEDALELKLTWEEAQDLLRPPPTVTPSIVKIEDHEFEEYEEPPVFGKKTIFTARSSGGQNQWVQCDSCSRWRKLPADVLLPSKWTCADNAWDPERSSCSVPDEMSRKDLDKFLRMNMDIKKRRVTANRRPTLEREPSALDALANVAALGDNAVDPEIPSVATTTRHPRHRPGCSCIVCIQPPSGKGPKHKPTCNCNVCMTVRRRFETLMMRKKKRHEFEGEIAIKKTNILIGPNKDVIEGGSKCRMLPPDGEETRPRSSESKDGHLPNFQTTDTTLDQIDLNCDPDRDQSKLLRAGPSSTLGVSMMSLLQEASFPLETYLKQNGLTSLAWENHQGSSSSHGAAAVSPREVIGEDNHEGIRPSTPDEIDIAAVQEIEIEGGDERQPSVNDDPGQEE